MHLTFVTPRLSPAVCGLADHTAFLARALSGKGIDVSYIFCRWQQAQAPMVQGRVTAWDGRPADFQRCVKEHRADWIWIQLSGYGYSRWGAPAILARSLKKMHKALPALRVATYAHELYCDPHQLGLKGTLLSSWQRRTVGEILRQSDVVFSSTPEYLARIVEQLKVPRERTQIIPIGSNVPMPSLTTDQRASLRADLGWSQDERVAVVFGSFGSQTQTLERFSHLLSQGLQRGALQRIVAIGGVPGTIPSALLKSTDGFRAAGKLDVLGHQPASRIGSILQACDIGIIAYPRHLLRKSGVFMAYACAGLAVLSFDDAGNKMTMEDKLPILEAEHWRWDDAKSERVKALQLSLRSYAEEHWKWESIAVQVLDSLGYRAQNRSCVHSGLSSAP